jgi:hypothetical protein
MVERGEVEFDACHHHGTVGPMAGVTSASMKVYVVENVEHGNKAFSNLNEGYGKVLRYGAYSEDVLKKLHWMNDVLGVALADALAQSDGIDLRALIAEALHMGDEGHNRNKAGSLIYLKLLAPLIAKVVKDDAVEAEILQFLGDNALSVLNPVMAACKAMTDAAHGVEGSTIVTTMARNGTDFGIRVSVGKVDVALLPVAGWGPRLGPGHLDPGEAASAAARIGPRVAIPIHWGSYQRVAMALEGHRSDPARRFCDQLGELAPGVAAELVEPGAALVVDPAPSSASAS